MWLFNLLSSSLSQLWYVEVRISRSVSVSPLEFEITRVNCNSSFGVSVRMCYMYPIVAFPWCLHTYLYIAPDKRDHGRIQNCFWGAGGGWGWGTGGGGGGGWKGVVNFIKLSSLHPYSTYSERRAWANIVDPDQMPQTAASDQGLHCLPIIQRFYTHS